MKMKNMVWIGLFSLIFLVLGYGIGSRVGNNTEQADVPPEETEEVEQEETSKDIPDEGTDINQTLADWMPRLNNVVYHYEGFGNEFASFTWTPQFNQDDHYQFSIDNSGTTVVEIYKYTDDEIIRVFSRPETYFRDNFASIGTIDKYKENEVVLKSPIALGTNWSSDEATYEITAIDSEVSVPAGNYQTIEVTAEYENSIIKKYYAEKVGLVYELTETDDFDVESKLEKIETNQPEEIPLTVYQSDNQVMGLDQIPTKISLETNDSARLALQELFTGETEDYEDIYLLPKGTKINYMFLNKDDVVEVDLSKEYVTNMNAGSSGESFYLTGLGNTLAQYYGVEKVLLTIDGENYEGGHIILNEDEPLLFDDSMVNE